MTVNLNLFLSDEEKAKLWTVANRIIADGHVIPDERYEVELNLVTTRWRPDEEIASGSTT